MTWYYYPTIRHVPGRLRRSCDLLGKWEVLPRSASLCHRSCCNLLSSDFLTAGGSVAQWLLIPVFPQSWINLEIAGETRSFLTHWYCCWFLSEKSDQFHKYERWSTTCLPEAYGKADGIIFVLIKIMRNLSELTCNLLASGTLHGQKLVWIYSNLKN